MPPIFAESLAISSIVAYQDGFVFGNSLEVQWLGLGTSTAGGPGSISGRGSRMPRGAAQKKKKKKRSFVLLHLSVFISKQNLGQLLCAMSSVNLISEPPMVSSQARPRTEPFGIPLETLFLRKIGPLPSLSVDAQ